MEYVKLGTAGAKVSRICLGTNMLGGYVDAEQTAVLINTFLDAGGNFIDGADIYSEGRSEEYLGKALKARRHEAFLATKVAGPVGQGPNDRGASRSRIMQGVEASLRRLDTDYIDLYIQHFWDAQTPLEESLRTLNDLVRQGKVRYIGLSNFNAWQVMKTLWTADRLGLDPPRSVQVQYNFMNRQPEVELFPMCVEQNLTITPYWVLQAGMFTGKYQRGKAAPEDSRLGRRPQMAARMMTDETFDVAEKVEQVARESGNDPAAVTIAWALSKPAVGSVIAGTSRPEQVLANCAAVDVQLSEEHLELLNGATPVPAGIRA